MERGERMKWRLGFSINGAGGFPAHGSNARTPPNPDESPKAHGPRSGDQFSVSSFQFSVIADSLTTDH